MKYKNSIAKLILVACFFAGCKQPIKNAEPLVMHVASPVATKINESADFKVIKSPLFTRLDSLFRSRNLLQGFNGSVIVAKADKIFYKGNFGFEDYNLKTPITENSSFQIASVSKTFTATAVLYLVEKGKISLQDRLDKYFPGIPYANVTVENLLSHRSGLPNYLHFGDKFWKDKSRYMSNEDLISILTNNPKIEGSSSPNTHFQYCNTNFALLASIIEKATGVAYPDFMQNTFFTPLGMKDSWVYNVRNPTAKKSAISYNSRWVKQNDDPYDGVYGDKGIYASSEDMLRWNLAFYSGKLISEKMQKEAYSPRSFEKPGFRNYGYGWRLMKQNNSNYLVYHNGWWHGNNTVFYRYVQDTFALIILSNKYNRGVYNVQPVFDIISGGHSKSTQNDGEE